MPPEWPFRIVGGDDNWPYGRVRRMDGGVVANR